MEEYTTYKVTFKETGDEWLFQYRKDGVIHSFTNIKGNRILTLLDNNQFPGVKKRVEDWAEKYKSKITVELMLEDYSFEAFWIKYNLKVKKELSQKAFEKLNLVDKILCFVKLPKYDESLLKTKQNKAHMVTWINQKRYNDEY